MSIKCDWGDASQVSQFHALVNLLAMRNGGQLDPLTQRPILSGYDSDPSYDSDDEPPQMSESRFSEADTDRVGPIATSVDDKLKRKFLDRFAKIVSREKGITTDGNSRSVKKGRKRASTDEATKSFVACACLVEHTDGITVYVTRNNGLDNADQNFFRRIESLSKDLAARHGKHAKGNSHISLHYSIGLCLHL